MGLPGLVRRALTVRECCIGVLDMRLEDLVRAGCSVGAATVRPPVRWLRKPWFVRYQADPFLLESDGHASVYYEEVLFGSDKGRLMWSTVHPGQATLDRHAMISLSGHASYPCVFSYGDRLYCVPETGSSRQISLLEARSPEGPWAKRATLLDHVSTRDNTLFQFGGRWWLFCTMADDDPASAQMNLHIWHAPAPWGPWVAHRLQPAKSDIHSARPAGRPFLVDGELYRPAQDCWPRYGQRTVINRITALTPDDFREEVLVHLEPDPRGRCPDGLHTLTGAGGLVMVDGFREGLLLNPVTALLASIPRIRRRVPRIKRV